MVLQMHHLCHILIKPNNHKNMATYTGSPVPKQQQQSVQPPIIQNISQSQYTHQQSQQFQQPYPQLSQQPQQPQQPMYPSVPNHTPTPPSSQPQQPVQQSKPIEEAPLIDL
ncbi:hypothetical protein BDC45DRAFT_533452 [Circinella umbellata]|nr:hypothetical protein BDC45DRAFT_533452 [Circinella umbellata]